MIENALEKKIYLFAQELAEQKELLALLKVGYEDGNSPEDIAVVLIISVLLRFHKMPVKAGETS